MYICKEKILFVSSSAPVPTAPPLDPEGPPSYDEVMSS